MRRPLLLLLAIPLALSGCFGGDGDEDPPVVSSPAAASPAPEPPTPVSPVVTPTPTPPAPEPKVVYNGTHDFTGPPPLPNAPPKSENFTVDPGYATLQVRIGWTGASSGPTGDVTLSAEAKVQVIDPAGTVALACNGKGDVGCSQDLSMPAPGAWRVEYSGSGTDKVTVTITEIP